MTPNLSELRKEITNWKISRFRILDLAVGLSALLIYELVGRPLYRPYIYSKQLFDFHVADTLGNSLGTIATVFFFLFLLGRDAPRDYFLINTVTISVAAYEVAHPLLGKPIDPWDIIATLLAGGGCLLIYRLLRRDHNHSTKS